MIPLETRARAALEAVAELGDRPELAGLLAEVRALAERRRRWDRRRSVGELARRAGVEARTLELAHELDKREREAIEAGDRFVEALAQRPKRWRPPKYSDGRRSCARLRLVTMASAHKPSCLWLDRPGAPAPWLRVRRVGQ